VGIVLLHRHFQTPIAAIPWFETRRCAPLLTMRGRYEVVHSGIGQAPLALQGEESDVRNGLLPIDPPCVGLRPTD
ncbi:MAG: hypothetical protein ACJ8EA_25515, partial [Xanthobacteraceae bacterium]